jgi:hypothetical protein
MRLAGVLLGASEQRGLSATWLTTGRCRLPRFTSRAPRPSWRISEAFNPVNGTRSLFTAPRPGSASKPLKGVPFRVHPEVEHALDAGIPVVALETAILTHGALREDLALHESDITDMHCSGLPYPHYEELPKQLSKVIREEGCVPALVAIVNGVLKVGLDESDLAILLDRSRPKLKISRRDLAFAIAQVTLGFQQSLSSSPDLSAHPWFGDSKQTEALQCLRL